MQTIAFVLLGYLSGSVLYARIFSKLFGEEEMIEKSKDKNPGTANAFVYGGFWCGVLTLICDIGKGFLPVWLYLRLQQGMQMEVSGLALVFAAPVVGHVFPVFYRGRGGKGIAVTFGSMLGLFPLWQPAVILAAYFIFFSTVLRISPHYYRTLAAYFCSLYTILTRLGIMSVSVGFVIITAAVCIRMFASEEEKGRLKVKLLWMH